MQTPNTMRGGLQTCGLSDGHTGNAGIRTFPFCRSLALCGVTCAALALVLLSGCGASSYVRIGKQKMLRATPENPAVHILAIWEPSEGRGLDGLPTKGFAGQLLFITRRSNSPVVVDGSVRVYVFDDVGTVEEQGRPIHQFDFSPEAWNVHVQNTTLGPSYHVFIPYTRENNPYQTKCALRVRMVSSAGEPIYSDLVEVTLPGKKRADYELAKSQTPAKSHTPAKPQGQSSVADAILAEYEQLKAARDDAPEPSPEVAIKHRAVQVGTITKDGKAHAVKPAEKTVSNRLVSTAEHAAIAGDATTSIRPTGAAMLSADDETESRIRALEERIAQLLEANAELATRRGERPGLQRDGRGDVQRERADEYQRDDVGDDQREHELEREQGKKGRRFRLGHPLGNESSAEAPSASRTTEHAGDADRWRHPLNHDSHDFRRTTPADRRQDSAAPQDDILPRHPLDSF